MKISCMCTFKLFWDLAQLMSKKKTRVHHAVLPLGEILGAPPVK
jgi:hypothetical protein